MQNTQVNTEQRNSWAMDLHNILDQSKQSIYVNKNEHPTGTLATTFLNPARGSNPYFPFVYISQKIFNHTQRQVLGSMNSYPENYNKQVKTQQH